MHPENSSSEPRQLVSFHLGEEEYAVDILCVQEIIRAGRITPVPNAPHFVEGVLNLRGKVIPVIHLRRRLGLPETEHTKQSRIVVVDLSPHTLGFMVDAVSEVIRVTPDRIDPAPAGPLGPADSYVLGVARLDGRLVMILDLARLLSAGETDMLAA